MHSNLKVIITFDFSAHNWPGQFDPRISTIKLLSWTLKNSIEIKIKSIYHTVSIGFNSIASKLSFSFFLIDEILSWTHTSKFA